MATQTASSDACATCGKPATTRCAGCSDTENSRAHTVTLYCGKECQIADWQLHKKSCQAIQAKSKLFRASQLLQECFFATRAEAFDLSIKSVEVASNGTIHIFEGIPPTKVLQLSLTPAHSVETRNAVLSFRAGRDVFSGLMLDLSRQAFKGYTSKVEEVHVRMFDSRISTYHHHADNPSTAVFDNVHHVLRVTLKDNSTWAVDLAGAQHGQYKPVLPFSDYDKVSIAKILETRPFGASEGQSEIPVNARNPGNMFVALSLIDNTSHQADEFAEWEYHHATVQGLLKAKSDLYQTLKAQLVKHLATQAREYVKLALGDPSSKARLITVSDVGIESMSEDDKGRMERKKARKLASMDTQTRSFFEEFEANGTSLIMY